MMRALERVQRGRIGNSADSRDGWGPGGVGGGNKGLDRKGNNSHAGRAAEPIWRGARVEAIQRKTHSKGKRRAYKQGTQLESQCIRGSKRCANVGTLNRKNANGSSNKTKKKVDKEKPN